MLPHWWNVALIVFGPGFTVVPLVLVLAWRWRAGERQILFGALAIFGVVFGLLVLAWLSTALYTDPPRATIRNASAWPIQVQINDEEPVDLGVGATRSFTEPEAPIPGYGLIDQIAITGGRDGSQRFVIDGDSGDQYASIVVHGRDTP